MAKFYIGQRVMILWSISFPELRGCFGTIVGKVGEEARAFNNQKIPGEWYVAPDAWGGSVVPEGQFRGMQFTPDVKQLCPSDCYEVVSWNDEEMLWKPEQYRENNGR